MTSSDFAKAGSMLWWLALLVRLTIVSLVLAWPYGLTTLLMRNIGVNSSSAWSLAAAWTAESLWLLMLLAGAFTLIFGTPAARRQARDDAERQG